MKQENSVPTMTTVRLRYDALGSEKIYFGVALIATIIGLCLPLVESPFFALTGFGNAMHFYNLGAGGWCLALALLVAAIIAFVRPRATIGVAAIPLLALAAGVVGMLLAVVAVASFGIFTADGGTFAWLIAGVSLVTAYSRRIFRSASLL